MIRKSISGKLTQSDDDDDSVDNQGSTVKSMY